MNNWGSYSSCSSVCREHCLSVDNSFLGILAEGIFHVFQGYLPLELMNVQKNIMEDRFKQNAVFSFFPPLKCIFLNGVLFYPSPLNNICAIYNNGRYCIFENPNRRDICSSYYSYHWRHFFWSMFCQSVVQNVDFSASWKLSFEIISPEKCTIKHSEA